MEIGTKTKKKAATTKKKVVKKAVKKMALALEIKKEKKYSVLRKEPNEVRFFQPAKRTILLNGGVNHFMQLPYMALGFLPHGTGGFLFGCFTTEDLSQMSEKELMEAKVYMMPFPYQLDNGPWGPCCLIHHSPFYFFQGDFDKLIAQFYQTSFRGLGDYGQKNVSCWSNMTVDEVFGMLKKSPPYCCAPFKNFLQALDGFRKGSYGY